MTDIEYLRELAAHSRQQRATREYPNVTLARAADLLEARRRAAIEEDATDPRALILRECPNCGASVPAAWTPPEG